MARPAGGAARVWYLGSAVHGSAGAGFAAGLPHARPEAPERQGVGPTPIERGAAVRPGGQDSASDGCRMRVLSPVQRASEKFLPTRSQFTTSHHALM